MNVTKFLQLSLIACAVALTAAGVRAEVVEYSLENVVLDDSSAQMSGTFTWTYDVGDFENGVGVFTFLEIPFTAHDHTDLTAMVDVGSSVEITLEGSVHDDGVDITLVLMQPLTPTSGTAIDLTMSHYEIGGNGFHDGLFLSGSIEPTAATAVGDGNGAPVASLAIHPNPFNPVTTLSYDLSRPASLRIGIHDLSGRLVRTLVAEQYRPAGGFTIDWRGRDDAGRALPSGMYLVHMKAGDESVTRKVMLTK